MFDALPEAFGSYRVLEALGEGRFGPVYRARDDATGLFAAIKVFDQGLTAEHAARLVAALERLQDAPLAHPAIVPVVAAGVENERAWVAEPWLDAAALDALMRRDGALPFAEVLLRVAQMAGALDFAAAVGIHHGALHPRDILISGDTGSGDETLLVGIGVLQGLNEAGLAVPMEGTYVAPQRTQGLPVSRADDVFALAAITFELVYGEPVPPRSQLRSAVTPLAGIDHTRFAALLERALSSDADHRPPTALAFAESIQAVRLPIQQSHPVVPVRDAAQPVRDVDPPMSIRDVDPAISVRDEDPVIPIRDAAPAIPIHGADPVIPIRDAAPAAADLPLRASAAKRESDDEAPAPPIESQPEGYWFPISATLAIGLLMGFAGGYVVGQREAVPTPHAAERPVARNQPPATPEGTGGRDFTESVVPPAERPPAASDADPPQGAPDRPDRSDPAVLQVDSRPRGARVFLDGRLVGMTPVVVADVSPGAHAVRIDLRGHRRWVTTVDVAPGERERVAASLER